ncbi:epimerase [Arsenicicoccus piscis]|uniref:Epimerase n=1 Tax=Arsenicicoccus piscis TaxID=673954 RepID=A0ABQ6HQW0_9MICO|nr:epimerase [Arsenicicoccus piscis]
MVTDAQGPRSERGSLRVVVSGATGLIGTALVRHLRARGDQVVRLVRAAPTTPDDVRWDPTAHDEDSVVDLARRLGRVEGLRGPGSVDAIVNLAGAPIAGQRWTSDYRVALRRSRVDATTTCALLAGAIGSTLVNGSAVGIYGSDRGEEPLTETSAPGTTFLAGVVQDWEAATAPATDAGVRVALARTGIVLSRHGGALAQVLPLARLGLGGPLGSGWQYWPWITLEDEVRALTALIDEPYSGPVNLVAPVPVHQRELMRLLGRRLHRPAVLPAPAVALRLVLGEFADDILGSQLVRPTVLKAGGFEWAQPDPADGVAYVVG